MYIVSIKALGTKMTENTLLENQSSESLGVSLTKTIGNESEKIKTIQPGETMRYETSFGGGCGRMTVWTDHLAGGQLIWNGIIPLGGANPIKIENINGQVKVSAADGALPQCHPDVKQLESEIKKAAEELLAESSVKERPTWWWVLLFVTFLLGVYLLKHYYL